MGMDAIIEFKYSPTKHDLVDLSYRMKEALFHTHIFYEKEEPAFSPVEEYDEATESFVSNEEFLSVNTWQRWYGPGYERGDWPSLSMAIRWLLINVGPDVYYYSDYAERRPENTITFSDLAELDGHWAHVGGLPYRGYLNKSSVRSDEETGSDCCGFPTEARSWGPDGVGYYCPSCGKRNGAYQDGI